MSVLVQHEERPEGGRVARLTIDNAGKLNSLNRALMAEIIETAGKLATDPQLRLLVLTGTGERAFVVHPGTPSLDASHQSGQIAWISLLCC